jgi:hypothetical protein
MIPIIGINWNHWKTRVDVEATKRETELLPAMDITRGKTETRVMWRSKSFLARCLMWLVPLPGSVLPWAVCLRDSTAGCHAGQVQPCLGVETHRIARQSHCDCGTIFLGETEDEQWVRRGTVPPRRGRVHILMGGRVRDKSGFGTGELSSAARRSAAAPPLRYASAMDLCVHLCRLVL